MTQNSKNKYNNKECDNKMTFQDCELAILRHAVDENESILGEKIANSEDVKAIIKILENFLVSKKCICYGGTAINNLLPLADQFYDPKSSIPDYDMFSETPQLHAMIIADLLKEADIHEVEVRPGVHMGTFKVFANYTGVADITFLNPDVFDSMWEDSIEKDKGV
jgi:hypothetical protein